MKYGYAHVSTDDQNTDLQLSALKSGLQDKFCGWGQNGATL